MTALALKLAAAFVAALPAAWAADVIARRVSEAPSPPRRLVAGGLILAAFVWAAAMMPATWLLAAGLGLAWALVVLALVDLSEFRLPDVLTLPLIAAGLAVSAALPDAPVLDHLIGTLVGGGSMALIGWGFKRLRGYEGLGLGDAKLVGAAGAWLGWAPLPSVILIACAGGFAIAAFGVMRHGRGGLKRPIPFGPAICLGLWIVWLHGPLPALGA